MNTLAENNQSSSKSDVEPLVTIVVSPRERFSCTEESLNSIYEFTRVPFKLIYVDGGSPQETQLYLQEQAEAKQFHLIRIDRYLSPNQARNIGLREVKTKYVVFIDNDVIVTEGWLSKLIECAESTDATVVGPLVCQGTPVHEIVHFAGGEARIWVDNNHQQTRRRLREKMYKQGKKVAEVRPALKRQETELAEFHCVLINRAIFDRIGSLDEQMYNTKEHLDFCMTVREAGGKVYFEPEALVTYVPGPPLAKSDILFYMLRWSNAWELSSLHRLRDKWNLAEDNYFQNRYRRLGWRRHMTILQPLASQLGLFHPKKPSLIYRIVGRLEKEFNRYLTNRYARLKLKK